jgi:hypothetical protein
MKNNLHLIEKAPRIACVWVSTGDARQPLACIWVEVPPAARAATPVKGTGGMRLCA